MRKDLMVVPSYRPKSVRIAYRVGGVRTDEELAISPIFRRRVTPKLARYFNLRDDNVLRAYHILEDLYQKERETDYQLDKLRNLIKERDVLFSLYHKLHRYPHSEIRSGISRLKGSRNLTETTYDKLYRYIDEYKERRSNYTDYPKAAKIMKCILDYMKRKNMPLYKLYSLYDCDDDVYVYNHHNGLFNSDRAIASRLRQLELQQKKMLKISRFISFGEESIDGRPLFYEIIIKYMEVREPIVSYLKQNSFKGADAVQWLFVQQGSTTDYDSYITQEAKRFASMNPDKVLEDLKKPIGKGWHKEKSRHRRAAKIGHIRRKYG